MPDPTSESPKRSTSRKIMQFSGMAMEMGILIFAGAWLGKQVDRYLDLQKPYFLLAGTLLFTLAAIYRVVRDLR